MADGSAGGCMASMASSAAEAASLAEVHPTPMTDWRATSAVPMGPQ